MEEIAADFTEDEIISPKDLPVNMYSEAGTGHQEIPEQLKDAMKIYERNHISAELSRNNNNKELTAKVLGISISSLYRKIEELGIPLKQ